MSNSFAQNIPCVPDNISYDDFIHINASNAEQVDFQCGGKAFYLYAFGTADLTTPDQSLGANRYILPGVCGDEIYGSLQISLGAPVTNDQVYEVCYQLRDLYDIIQHDFISSTFTKPDPNDSDLPDLICGLMDFSGLPLNDEPDYPSQLCLSTFVKPKMDVLGIKGDDNIDIFLNPIGETECFEHKIQTVHFQVEQPSPGSQSDFFQHVSGQFYYSSMDPNDPEGMESNVHVLENSTFIFDIPTATQYTAIDFFMDANSKIVIEEGVTLTLKNCDFRGCQDVWESIEVRKGGILFVIYDDAPSTPRRSTISGAEIGINALPGSSINISNSDFLENITDVSVSSTNSMSTIVSISDNNFYSSERGIYFTGDGHNMANFNDNLFDNNGIGIHVEDTNSAINLECPSSNKNIFDNCGSGIQINNAAAFVRYNKFINNGIGIRMFDNIIRSSLFFNDIGYRSAGISSVNGSFDIARNSIGLTDGKGQNGILLVGDQINSEIRGNWVYAKNTGILSILSSRVDIHDNPDINVTTSAGVNSSGIHLFMSLNNVADNQITCNNASAGIWLSGCTVDNPNVQIVHNGVQADDGFRTSAIRLEGSSLQNIHYNLTEGEVTNGVLNLNSANNDYQCNELHASNTGMFISSNSMTHNIEGNEMHASLDFDAESPVGTQFHAGNKFFGLDENSFGDSEVNVSSFAAVGSKFIVDRVALDEDGDGNTEYWPDLIDPSDLFDEGDSNGSTYDCDGKAGPGLTIPTSAEFCRIFSQIKNNNQSANARRINIYHWILFYLEKLPMSAWPECLKKYINSEDCNGLVILSKAQQDLQKLFSNTPLDRNGGDRRRGISDGLDQIEIDLDRFDCVDNLLDNNKNVLKIVIHYLRYQTLTPIMKIDLKETAALCPAEYGDAVHWARSLLRIGNGQRYDENDDLCGRNIVEGRSVKKSNEFDILIYPNPAQNKVLIKSERLIQSIQLRDQTSRVLSIYDNIHDDSAELDLSIYHSGIYLLIITDDTGASVTKKITLIE